jgi:hypothetical protein
MRRPFRAVAFALAAASFTACAALAGLDEIRESDCAPDLCADASSAVDAVPEATVEVGTDAHSHVEAGATDAGSADGGPAQDAARPNGEAGADDEPEAASGTDGEASTDASSAEGGSAESGSADAAPEAEPHDAGPVDAPPDSPCGTVYLSESFGSAPPGWTLDTTWSVATTCASPPAPQKGNPDPAVDHTSFMSKAGGVVAAYACGNNPAGTTSAFRYATSPAVDVSSAQALTLRFYRWLNSDANGWMTSTVDVFDGASWVNVYTNPSGAGQIVADSAWTLVEYDVTAHKNAAFRVRFGYAVTDAGVYSMSCWNVDDVVLSTAACP